MKIDPIRRNIYFRMSENFISPQVEFAHNVFRNYLELYIRLGYSSTIIRNIIRLIHKKLYTYQ